MSDISGTARLFMSTAVVDGRVVEGPRFPWWECSNATCAQPLGSSALVVWPRNDQPVGVGFWGVCSASCLGAIRAAGPADVEWQTQELGQWFASLLLNTGTSEIARRTVDRVLSAEYMDRARGLGQMPRSTKKGS